MAWFSKTPKTTTEPMKHAPIPITLHNTLGNAAQAFVQQPGREVRMYNCGPTVYGPAHIGNLRAYVFADVLRRMLQYNGLTVKQVINITDVGHLTSNEDAGEDKMSKGLRREKMELTLENMHTLAERYAGMFIQNLGMLSIVTDDIEFPRASAYVEAMIAMIQTLEDKGYTYRITDGVYFDTSRFPAYGALGNIDIEGQKEGARIEANPEKRNPADFNLWKLSSAADVQELARTEQVKDDADAGAHPAAKAHGTHKKAETLPMRLLGWKSPWGIGFPGWHIECSAMARVTLGEQIDIHTGGIDHIPVHHNNEIAQSESATGKRPFARMWMHSEFITIDDAKISKSLENDITLEELPKEGLHTLALRYFYLSARYSTPVNFSWESLRASQSALVRLHFLYTESDQAADAVIAESYRIRFHERINDDLDTPGALAVIWEMLKDKDVSSASMRATLANFETVLGLSLGKADAAMLALIRTQFGEVIAADALPEEIRTALTEREAARAAQDWGKADTLRDQIQKAGYAIEDTPAGGRILKK
jgi:cysteinyl-tRNA synthetase